MGRCVFYGSSFVVFRVADENGRAKVVVIIFTHSLLSSSWNLICVPRVGSQHIDRVLARKLYEFVKNLDLKHVNPSERIEGHKNRANKQTPNNFRSEDFVFKNMTRWILFHRSIFVDS